MDTRVKNLFHQEYCILVASSEVDFRGTKIFINEYVKDLIAKGIYTKILFLTGSHGKENGQDGMVSLECLSDSQEYSPGTDEQSQTRSFYVEWCYFFRLPVEGEDPREYNPTTGQVTGIKDIVPPEWAVRKPNRVPNIHSNLKKSISELEVQIVDIAFYHGKTAELLKVVEKFQPTTLIIDWCHTRGGFTSQQLTSSGIVSQIILENELSIITSRGWIKLSEEQKKILNGINNMEMKSDCDHPNWSITFLHGPYGSGKTVLGIEIGRILRSKRQLMNPMKNVRLLFCAPKREASSLLRILEGKYYKIEEMGHIGTINDLFEKHQLGEYRHHDDKAQDTIDKIGQALSLTGDHHVVIIDELSYDKDFSQMKKHANVDMVFLAKPKYNGEKEMIPPSTDNDVRVHELGKCYRQGKDSFMANKFMLTHANITYSLSDAKNIISEMVEGCPPGQSTVWIKCQEGVEVLTALKAVKNVLDEDKDHVTVVKDFGGEASKDYCAKQGWTWIPDGTQINGYEDDVVVIVGPTRGEITSRARRRIVFVTWPGNASLNDGLSDWSSHMTSMKSPAPCRLYSNCPFMGEMPDLVIVDS